MIVWGLGIAFLLGGQVMLLATLVSRVERLEHSMKQEYATKEYVDSHMQALRLESVTEHTRIIETFTRRAK